MNCDSRFLSKRNITGGYSLIEMAIVFAIFGIVLGAVWVAAGRAWDTSRREQAQEAIATTVTNVRSYLGGQVGVPNLGYAALTSQLLSANVIPSYLNRGSTCSGNACADNPWGPTSGNAHDPNGTFRVCGWILGTSTSCLAAAPGTISDFFGVALTGLSRKNCIALVETISSPTGPVGLVDININGKNLVSSPSPVPIQPVSDSDATTNCTSAANGNGSVTFVYRVVSS